MRTTSLRLAAVLGAAIVGAAHAQSTETPAPFDSAARVMTVTPPLAERLHLTRPVWPVQGDFRDARLFAIQPSGGFVLVVQRPAGTVERFPLTDSERSTLRGVIDAAMSAGGRPSMEAGSEVSEPAGSAFVRRQTLLAAGIYGPLAASLSDDGSVAGALWLVVTGGTFFASYGASESQAISRAQNHLAGHLGLASGLAAGLLTYAVSGDDGGKGVRAAALAGGAAGTIAGLSLARPMSDAEAHAATGGIESAALVGWAATQAAGLSERGTAGAVAAAVIAGYPIGLAYPRSVSYTVTAGDVDAVGSAGLIGGLAAGTFLGDRPSKQTAAAVLGAGYVLGLALGDRLIARPFDLTQSESNLAGIGAVAGGLIGLAIPVLAGSHQSNFVVGTAALGATLGFTAVVNMSRHRVGGAGSVNKSLDLPGRKLFRNINVSGPSLLGPLARVPGRYSVVNWSF